jgi:hypothetical protein
MVVTTGTPLSATGEMICTSSDEEEEQELLLVTGGLAELESAFVGEDAVSCVVPLVLGGVITSMDVTTTLNTIKMVPKVARPTRCRVSRSIVLGQGILPIMAKTMRTTAAMMKKIMGALKSWSRNIAISCLPFSYLESLIALSKR